MKPIRSRALDSGIHRFLRVTDAIAGLPDFGPLCLQVRGTGGGLGKTVPRLEPIRIPGLAFSFDPDCGFGFALDRLDAIHARLPGEDSCFNGSLELEFENCPQGVGLHLLRGGGIERPLLSDLIRQVPTRRIDEEELLDWRESRRSFLPMCPCCEQRARLRARHPEAHPIYPILHHARSRGLTLDCRLPAEHADLTVSLRPAVIEVNRGYLIVTDAGAIHSLHLDMKRLHALAIDEIQLDGLAYASLRLFDSRGGDTFRILCEEPEVAQVWREMCENEAV